MHCLKRCFWLLFLSGGGLDDKFAIFKIFAAWQDSVVLSQICIFVCGLNLFLPFCG